MRGWGRVSRGKTQRGKEKREMRENREALGKKDMYEEREKEE